MSSGCKLAVGPGAVPFIRLPPDNPDCSRCDRIPPGEGSVRPGGGGTSIAGRRPVGDPFRIDIAPTFLFAAAILQPRLTFSSKSAVRRSGNGVSVARSRSMRFLLCALRRPTISSTKAR